MPLEYERVSRSCAFMIASSFNSLELDRCNYNQGGFMGRLTSILKNMHEDDRAAMDHLFGKILTEAFPEHQCVMVFLSVYLNFSNKAYLLLCDTFVHQLRLGLGHHKQISIKTPLHSNQTGLLTFRNEYNAFKFSRPEHS